MTGLTPAAGLKEAGYDAVVETCGCSRLTMQIQDRASGISREALSSAERPRAALLTCQAVKNHPELVVHSAMRIKIRRVRKAARGPGVASGYAVVDSAAVQSRLCLRNGMSNRAPRNYHRLEGSMGRMAWNRNNGIGPAPQHTSP